MLFKNAKIFQINSSLKYEPEALAATLQSFAFTPCLPSFPESLGWITPMNTDDSLLVYGANGYMLICLQLEEKLLPASVIRHAVEEKIKAIQAEEDRKVGHKEKQTLKDDITFSLRPRAFSRFSKIYAYVDTKEKLLIVDCASNTKLERFTHFLKKSLPSLNIALPPIKKPRTEMTYWLQNKTSPGAIAIEKSCVLQDPQDQTRVIRCQHQNLYANSIQSLIKDGCEVVQLALSWDDHLTFHLTDEFVLKSIRFQDEMIAAAKEEALESPDQKIAVDFAMMTESFKGLLSDLLGHFTPKERQ